MENKKLYDHLTVAAAYYIKKEYIKAAKVYSDIAKKYYDSRKYASREKLFIISGDAYMAADNPIDAINEYKNALKIINQNYAKPNRYLLSDTYLKIGDAYQLQTYLSIDIDKLRKSIEYYKKSLSMVYNEHQLTLWSKIQFSLGFSNFTRHLLDKSADGNTSIDKSIAYFREGLRFNIKDEDPLIWASTHYMLGAALILRKMNSSDLDEKTKNQVVNLFNMALTVFTKEEQPTMWVEIKRSYNTLTLELKDNDLISSLSEQIDILENELSSNKTKSLNWYRLKNLLANIYYERGKEEKKGGVKSINRAIDIYNEVLESNRKSFLYFYYEAKEGLADALISRVLLSERINRDNLMKAIFYI